MLITSILLTLCAQHAACSTVAMPETSPQATCMLRAYPEALCGIRSGVVFWCDGELMPWDDERAKDAKQRLEEADFQDQMHAAYPRGKVVTPPTEDPGRVRYMPMFEKLYGASANEVRQDLVRITWMPKTSPKKIRVTSRQGVAKRLEAVSKELEGLPLPVRQIAAKFSGTFVWRKIKGTNRRSAHSFGVAIDVGVPKSDYWRWTKPDAQGRYTWRNRIPYEIVEVFERYGFIWGGKWMHFDTMHFEYRPELLFCATPSPQPMNTP